MTPAVTDWHPPWLAPYFERHGPLYRWLVVTTTMMATITVVLSSTIVNVALPDIMGAFGIGQDKAQWMSTGFLAAMTAAMLLNAWLNDKVGIRATFIGALALFASASVVGGLAPNENVLTLARVAQGVAAGVVQPLAMFMIFSVFPSNERGRAMGIYGIGVVLAPAVGPVVGGWLTDNFDWRWVFFMGLPTSIGGILMGSIFLPMRSGRTAARRFDFPGLALLVLFLVSILYALSNGQREGWDSNLIIGFLWASALLFVAFVAWELYTPTPLVNLVVFGVARFAAAAVVALIFGAGIYGSTYLVPLFVQTIQGYTPTRSGELLMPAGLMLGVVFPLAGRLTDRLPAYLIIAVGLGIFGLSNLLFYRADVDSSFWQLSFLVLLGRVGLGFVTPALNAGALSVLPQEMLAQGTGTINFIRQLGGALGVSLLSALVEIRYAFHADALTAMQNEANSSTVWEIGLYAGLDKVWGVTHSQLHAGALDHLGKVLVAQAQRMAYDDGFAVVGVLFWLGVLPALWMRRKRS